MLKDAALLTLQLMKESIAFGMTLKDATPYNVQWHNGRMTFIDTLSFEKYDETKPWIAYRQFCECFLGPLLLTHYSKQPLHNLLLSWPDGIPLPVIRSLLPFRSRFSLFTYLHIHLHEKLTRPGKQTKQNVSAFSKTKMLNLVNSLESVIKGLKAPSSKTNWSDYYEEAGQRGDYVEQKKIIIEKWLNEIPGIQTAVDLGANDGYFSELVSSKNVFTVSAEADAVCVNNLYLQCKEKKKSSIHPAIIDLTNPSPAIGVNRKKGIDIRHSTDFIFDEEKMKINLVNILKTYPLFVFLLPLFFVLHGYNVFYPLIPASDLLLLTCLYLAGAILLFFLFWFIYKKWSKAAVLAFVLQSFNFFFGPVHDFLKGSFFGRYSFLLPFILILSIIIFLVVRKTTHRFIKVTQYLNLLFILLCIIDIISILGKSSFSKS